jgi:hypothetical protein
MIMILQYCALKFIGYTREFEFCCFRGSNRVC